MVTLKTIAQLAGVSEATVSLILNHRCKENRPSMKAKAARIRALAAQLGYKPHAAARAIARRRFDTICILQDWDHRRSYLPPSLLEGIQTVLKNHGQKLLFDRWQTSDLSDPESLPVLLKETCADGLLINIHVEIPPTLQTIIAQVRWPVVWINAPLNQNTVVPNDVQAGYQLTKILYQQGCRNIIYIDYNFAFIPQHHSRTCRYQGYELAMHELGLQPILLTKHQNSPDFDPRKFEEEWSHQSGIIPDGIITYDIGHLNGLWSQGGFARKYSHFIWGTFHDWPLTHLDGYIMVNPWLEVGKTAAETLLHFIRNQESSPKPVIKVPFTCYYRDQTIPL